MSGSVAMLVLFSESAPLALGGLSAVGLGAGTGLRLRRTRRRTVTAHLIGGVVFDHALHDLGFTVRGRTVRCGRGLLLFLGEIRARAGLRGVVGAACDGCLLLLFLFRVDAAKDDVLLPV